MSYNYQYEYGKDFGTIRSYLGQSEESLAEKLLTTPETIRKIENSVNLFDIEINDLFRIYYFSKTVAEYEYISNQSINKLAESLARKAHQTITEIVKENQKKKEEAKKEEIQKTLDTIEKTQKELVIDEIIKKDFAEEEKGLNQHRFLELLLSAMIIRNYQPPVIDLEEISKDLYKLKQEEGFSKLFENVTDAEDQKVELKDAFKEASRINTLIKISVGSSNEIYLINMNENQAKESIKEYEEKDILKMIALVDRLKDKRQEHEQERGPILQKIQTIRKYED